MLVLILPGEMPPKRPSPPARPLQHNTKDTGHRYTLAQQIQCLKLLSEGRPAEYVERKSGIKQQSQSYLLKQAIARGYRPEEDPRILESYVVDGVRSGRPRDIGEDKEEEMLSAVRSDRSGREESSEVLAYFANISQSSIQRILRKYGLRKVKPTTKPGLTAAMRKARLEWALAHRHWTLEDWKNVIWTDETSVMLGHRRG